ncbi:MAG: bifunctional adenosylcobinamide kinase/adenosylcobinamide-phosphate guanylyltransferase [Actinomycetota bacterium]
MTTRPTWPAAATATTPWSPTARPSTSSTASRASTARRSSIPGLSTRQRSNEVGLGIVPMHPLGRAYRDALGTVNALWAAEAEQTFLVVAGKVLALADAPDVLASR